jgi:GNAT superfamily N-acetyltransferase
MSSPSLSSPPGESPSSSPRSPHVSTATYDDLPALVKLINEAYEVETGDTGVAFKKTLRLMDGEVELGPAVREGRCLMATLPGEGPGGASVLAGCLVWERVGGAGTADGPPLRLHFGPFAVSPAMQRRGVGNALLGALYDFARSEGAASIDIEVVHWRTDILPLYEKLGYVAFGEGAFPAPERTTRPCHFIMMRKEL